LREELRISISPEKRFSVLRENPAWASLTMLGAVYFAWDNALAAADFDALLDRPSRRTFDAAEAAFDEVVFLGAFVCERALAAADLDFLLVDLLRRTDDAFFATDLLVTFDRDRDRPRGIVAS
jgi:hypothetical protein